MGPTALDQNIRLITPDQLRAGYMVFHGFDVVPNVTWHRFEVVRRLESGNYVVREPR